MADDNVQFIHTLFADYRQGNLTTILDQVDPAFAWTYLDPSFADPEPQVCIGREQLQIALGRQLNAGFAVELEEIQGHGDHVMVVIHMPGIDQHRVRQANDRNYAVFTIQNGFITALRACHDRAEALRVMGAVS